LKSVLGLNTTSKTGLFDLFFCVQALEVVLLLRFLSIAPIALFQKIHCLQQKKPSTLLTLNTPKHLHTHTLPTHYSTHLHSPEK